MSYEEYNRDQAKAWQYVCQQLYKAAYLRLMEKYRGQPELWSLEGVDDSSPAAYMGPYKMVHQYSMPGPQKVDDLEPLCRRELQQRSLTSHLGRLGVPRYSRSTRDDKPDFFLPLEAPLFNELTILHEPGKHREYKAQQEARWAYTAMMNALYGQVRPSQRVSQSTWANQLSKEERVAFFQELLYHYAHVTWVKELQQLAEERKGRYSGYKFQVPGGRMEQPPSIEWARDYLEMGGECPRLPVNPAWLGRSQATTLVASSDEEWQWSYARADAEAPVATPLCVAVTVAMQESRRWQWVLSQPTAFLFRGNWDELSEDGRRAAYLRQLYRTASTWQRGASTSMPIHTPLTSRSTPPLTLISAPGTRGSTPWHTPITTLPAQLRDTSPFGSPTPISPSLSLASSGYVQHNPFSTQQGQAFGDLHSSRGITLQEGYNPTRDLSSQLNAVPLTPPASSSSPSGVGGESARLDAMEDRLAALTAALERLTAATLSRQ
jgi:hypothetical protein